MNTPRLPTSAYAYSDRPQHGRAAWLHTWARSTQRDGVSDHVVAPAASNVVGTLGRYVMSTTDERKGRGSRLSLSRRMPESELLAFDTELAIIDASLVDGRWPLSPVWCAAGAASSAMRNPAPKYCQLVSSEA